MRNKILKFFEPSRRKIITLVILIVLAALTVYLLIGSMFGCAMSFGCDTLSLGAFVSNVLGLVLVVPAYFIYAAPQMIFSDLDWPTSVMLVIMIVIELVYLYLLSCVITALIGRFKRKNKHPWSRRTTDLIIFISLAVIILSDGLAFPRRLDYLLQLTDGASFYIAKLSTAFKITALSIFEIWYLVFLFLRRKEIVWNKLFLVVIWLVVFALLALNMMMLGFSMFRF